MQSTAWLSHFQPGKKLVVLGSFMSGLPSQFVSTMKELEITGSPAPGLGHQGMSLIWRSTGCLKGPAFLPDFTSVNVRQVLSRSSPLKWPQPQLWSTFTMILVVG